MLFVNKTFAASSPDHQIIKYENIKNIWFGINKYNIHEAEENISTEKILILGKNFTMGKITYKTTIHMKGSTKDRC